MASVRRFAVAGLAGLLAGAAGLAGPLGAGAAEARSVVGTSRAQGVRGTYTVPDYVVVSEFFDGGGPVTESLADSTGRATSFSSLPWPGENAVTAPGTLSVAVGQSVPLAYPFYVHADHPTAPSAELKDPTGTYALAAAADAGRARAAGSFEGGGGVSGSRATTSAVMDDGGVVRVVAESVDTGISVAEGALRIASVRSRSETTLAPDDPEPVMKSELVIEGASLGGRPVTIGPDGVHFADQGVPAPIGQGVSSENELLGQAGLSVQVLPTGVPGGAEALVITSRQAIPAPNNPKGTLVLRIGGAASEIVVGNADLPVEAPPAGPAGGPTEAGAAPAAEPGRTAEAAPSGVVPSTAIGEADALERAGLFTPERQPLDFPLPAVSGLGGPTSPAGPVGEQALPAPAPLVLRAAPVLPDLATTGALFPILGVGGLMLVGVTRVHRWRPRTVGA